MKYLIDTCVVSELLRPRPNASVVAWLEHTAENSLFLSVLTVGEIQKGIEKLASGKRRNTLQRWVDQDLAAQFEGRILPVDHEVATTWGRIQAALEMAGKPLPTLDGLLCATAQAHNLTVVTRNTRNFEPSGVHVLNPWT